MRKLITAASLLISLFAKTALALTACPVTVGSLTLNVSTPRSACVSPCTIFFDSSGSTDTATLSGQNNVVQDVAYNYNFADANAASGLGNWTHGAGGGYYTAKNVATGIVAAHMYIVTDGTGDKAYTAVVTATDGTNTATCGVSVTVYDPVGSNGYTNGTTCYYNSAVGTGCPSGATQTSTSSIATATAALGAGKRVLLKCGDSFSGTSADIASSGFAKWQLGAYGSCVGTTASRPISSGRIQVSGAAVDGRVTDIDFEAVGSNAALSVDDGINTSVSTQITAYNLYSNGNTENFYFAQSAQSACISCVSTGAGSISSYFNYGNGTNRNTWKYNAVINSVLVGVGPGGSSGVETLRVGYATGFILENSTVSNANSVGAVLKFHNANHSCSGGYNCVTFDGYYSQDWEISDNIFTGSSGAQLTETGPQNASYDERVQYGVLERNLFISNSATYYNGGTLVYTGGEYISFRNNIFYVGPSNPAVGTGTYEAIVLCTRPGTGVSTWLASNYEVYNNTIYVNAGSAGGFSGVQYNSSGICSGVAATGSFTYNNLYYRAAGSSTVLNNGTGNTAGNNTTTATNSPAFKNASTAFSLVSDFKPTANYTGGASVPNFTDATGKPWAGTYDLGAVHH